eukprot:TRINITY_DN2318_c0_g2_i1.p1 TRINITY_DN2318_c0_g2~~TRINITY_DN2318_c0_g2_i1.p1  ORF type:complete len:377 (+),score=62.47 TRINITY_DN2318_c0_g2_i1:137-1267(+)
MIFSQAQYFYWTKIAKIDLVENLLSKCRHFDNEESHEALLAILSAFSASAPQHRTDSEALARQFLISPIVSANFRALDLLGDASHVSPSPMDPLDQLNLLFRPQTPSVITTDGSDNVISFRTFIGELIDNIQNGTALQYQRPEKGNYPRADAVVTRPLLFDSIDLDTPMAELASDAFNKAARLIGKTRPPDAIKPSKTPRLSANNNELVAANIASLLAEVKSEPGFIPRRFIPGLPEAKLLPGQSFEDANVHSDDEAGAEAPADDDEATDDDSFEDALENTTINDATARSGNSSRIRPLWDSDSEGEFRDVFGRPSKTTQSNGVETIDLRDLFAHVDQSLAAAAPSAASTGPQHLFAGAPKSRSELQKLKNAKGNK